VTIGNGFLGVDNHLDLGKETEVSTSTATTTLSSSNDSDKSSCQQGCVLVMIILIRTSGHHFKD